MTDRNSSNTLPSIRRRLASMLYESLLLLGVLAVTFIVPHLVIGMMWGLTLPGSALWLHLFLVFGAYFVWYWSHGGQTLAMQTWKIELRTVAGDIPSSRQAALRYLLAWPCLTIGGIGILWALGDKDRQFLHDRLAGTRVEFKH